MCCSKYCPDLYIAESTICANWVPSNILGGLKQLSQLLQLSISSSKYDNKAFFLQMGVSQYASKLSSSCSLLIYVGYQLYHSL